jgi:PTS system nitrogen regulatory IIA component
MAFMVDGDFSVESLAAYLHLRPEQVQRLADRGRLPGRRVGGQWRFSPAEIHRWLEDRIGVSEEAELARVEEAMQPTRAELEPALTASELLLPEAIQIPLAAKTRNSVIHEMCQVAARTGLLWDAEAMAAVVLAREEMHPTALDVGVALLHPRRPMPHLLAQAMLALGRCERGVPFGGSRGVLTDVFFLILSTDDRGHLRILARLSRMLSQPEFLEELRAAVDAEAALAAVRAAEARLPT